MLHMACPQAKPSVTRKHSSHTVLTNGFCRCCAAACNILGSRMVPMRFHCIHFSLNCRQGSNLSSVVLGQLWSTASAMLTLV